MGLDCTHVLGLTRWGNNQFNNTFHHSWVVFAFSDSETMPFYCPSDPTQVRVTLQRARELKGQSANAYSLPVHETEWGSFIWRLFATDFDGGKPIPSRHPTVISRWSVEEWKAIKPTNLQPLYKTTLAEMKSATISHVPD